MKFLAIIIAAVLGILCSSAEGTSCRRPRGLRRGRYEYQNSTDYELTKLPENYVVRVVCEPDTTLVGDEFIICQANEKWSDYPYCNAPIVCFLPPVSPANGYVRMRGKSARSIAVYRCNPGFQLHGKRTVVCDETTGRWQGDVPRCLRPPSCPNPAEPSGVLALALYESTGIKVGDLYTERTMFSYTCKTGYHPTRYVTTTCQNGTWIADADVPECNRITCEPPTLQSILHGSHNIENRTYDVGEVVQYECNEGYLVDGISWQVCQSNGGPSGIWSESVPSCKVARCPHPGSLHLDNGRVSFSPRNGRGATNSWPVGTVMTLTCSLHLELLGSSERVCQPDGHWNGTLTSCHSEEYYCLALGNPIHGSKVTRSPQYRVNSRVRFRCHQGYEMVGSEERICTISGEWTGEMPRCMGRDEFDEFTRVTSGLGKTFDEMAIEGGFWEGANDTTSNAGGRRKRSIDPSRSSGLDVFFAFDASKSVGEPNFVRGKKFAKLLVKELKVSNSPGGTRVGAVYYSSSPYQAFNTGTHDNSDEVVGAIEHLVNYTNEGTNLPDALKEIEIMATGNPREQGKSTRVLFIITDGMSNVGGTPLKNARKLREELDFKIHCIGISRNTDRTALAEIASEPTSEHVFFLSDYVELEHTVETIVNTNRSYDECGKAGSRMVRTSRVTGGNVVKTPGRWPWMAALYDGNAVFQCGGTLIDKKWVLTAAHCFDDDVLSKETMTVYLGLTTRTENQWSQEFSVSQLIKHPDYSPPVGEDLAYHNDIALLKLDREATLNPFVRTVCLPPSITKRRADWFLSEKRTAKVIGWGHFTQRQQNDNTLIVTSDVLREVDIPVVNGDSCKAAMEGRELVVNTETEVCAGSGNGRDSCQGDSGGPLMVRSNLGNRYYRQIGIVSYGSGCGLDGTYGVYTRLPNFVDWVNEKMARNA